MNKLIFDDPVESRQFELLLIKNVQDFTSNIASLYQSCDRFLPQEKSQISNRILKLFLSYPSPQQLSQGQNQQQPDSIDQNVHIFLKPESNSLDINAQEFCESNKKTIDNEASSSENHCKQTTFDNLQEKSSKTIFKKQKPQKNYNEVCQRVLRKRKNPYENMNEDSSKTEFMKSQAENSQKDFQVQFLGQPSQQSQLVQVQQQENQESFDIQEYQDSQNSQNQKCQNFQYQVGQLNQNIKRSTRTKKQKKWEYQEDYQVIQKKRYRSYTQQQKRFTLQKAQQFGLVQTSKMYDIPRKNILRWLKQFQQNSFTRGRKPINPFMQSQLRKWIKLRIMCKIYVSQNDIRVKARSISGDQNFKASKGWLQKFFKRNKEIGVELAGLLNEKRLQKKF